MTVFLPLALERHLDPANLSSYGRVVPLIAGSRPSIWDGAKLVELFKNALELNAFDPAQDHIALTGQAVYMAVMVAALWEHMSVHYPDDAGVSFLVYDASSSLYKEMRVPRARSL